MSKPPFTMSKYLNELDLQRDARKYYEAEYLRMCSILDTSSASPSCGVRVVSTTKDTVNYGGGMRVTLERGDGKKFIVNVPNGYWGDEKPYGLNLVFDHSGEGDHYE